MPVVPIEYKRQHYDLITPYVQMDERAANTPASAATPSKFMAPVYGIAHALYRYKLYVLWACAQRVVAHRASCLGISTIVYLDSESASQLSSAAEP
ncbi:hypothetical protein J6590_029959 [Homalodisca vitripennis]|nr:hypothetical protein J6590_029959 [Homalodisca vitripennis]